MVSEFRMAHTITHKPDQARFQTVIDGHLCVLDYQLQETVMIITHTEVPSVLAGQGIAAALTQTALDTARRRHWRVSPECSYAAVYIQRHPQYQDLLA